MRGLGGGRVPSLVAALAVASAWACDGNSVSPPVIDATGAVGGVVFLDFDGNERLSGPDTPLEGVPVRVILPGSGRVLAVDTTDAQGSFRIEDVPAGTIEVSVTPEALGDTLLALPLDSARFTLPAGGTAAVALGLTFPELSLAEVRAAEAGTPVFTRAAALNSRGQSPGGAIHVEGDGVALRVLVPPAFQAAPGDSLRIEGRVGVNLGQPALLDARLLRLVPGARDIEPRTPTMGEAASGVDGLDAALVLFTAGTVGQATTVPDGFELTATDGVDSLRVRLRFEQGFFQVLLPDGAEILRLTGLLVPDPIEEAWSLVPRSPADVSFGPPPTAATSEGDHHRE
ncbi:MAG: carboxypeptidase-like regulatory domain-containing protein [Longimicrobiales bacterium]|nr:carboxypeptidase-like regulatory domain-containing protein [Longimicrobiales bacterium]